MKLVADESVDAQIVEHLRQDGHDVTYIVEMEPGISDEIVLQTANAQEAILHCRQRLRRIDVSTEGDTPRHRVGSPRCTFKSNES